MTVTDEMVEAALPHYREGLCYELDVSSRREAIKEILEAALAVQEKQEPIGWLWKGKNDDYWKGIEFDDLAHLKGIISKPVYTHPLAPDVQAKPELAVNIKPLEWNGNHADIGFGKYEIWVFEECERWYFNVSAFAFMSAYSKDAIKGGPFDSEEEARNKAKIAAQGDYERRMEERFERR